MNLTYGELFAGIGGMSLGLGRAGLRPRWFVEVDPFCRRVLGKRWPDVPCYGDIRELTGDELEAVDLVAGGFPCPPVSYAGKRLGTEDERWLWPEFARIVRALRPRWVLAENVPGLLSANDGRAFGDILGDLAACGYDAEWDCIPAAAVGAPHLRDRVWVIAYPNGGGLAQQPQRHGREVEPGEQAPRAHDAVGLRGDVADTPVDGWGPGRAGRSDPGGEGELEQLLPTMAHAECLRRIGGTESEARNHDAQGADSGRQETIGAFGHGPELIGNHWTTEPAVGRVAHGVSGRVDRLRSLGNAVVPQVAEYVGRRIVAALDAFDRPEQGDDDGDAAG